MKICLAGEGAIGMRHLAALSRIDGVQLAALVAGDMNEGARLAADYGIPDVTTDLPEALRRADIGAVVLATPTPLHADQAISVLQAGKHCLVEIPMADSLASAEELARAGAESDRTAMVCHTRRFNPSHQWIRRRIARGELHLQHLVAETYFLRRTNTNALGRPRSWTDHLLWHHACHTVDLFGWQTSEEISEAYALQGPAHPDLRIAMDMSAGFRVPSGIVCTLALSFNNDGPFGTTFRYICQEGTYLARYDELSDGRGEPVDIGEVTAADGVAAADGIELQDREFVSAIRQGREPETSLRRSLPAMRVLGRLAAQLQAATDQP